MECRSLRPAMPMVTTDSRGYMRATAVEFRDGCGSHHLPIRLSASFLANCTVLLCRRYSTGALKPDEAITELRDEVMTGQTVGIIGRQMLTNQQPGTQDVKHNVRCPCGAATVAITFGVSAQPSREERHQSRSV